MPGPESVGRNLLKFEDLGLEITLEGCADDLAERLSRSWMCDLTEQAETTPSSASPRFRFELVPDPNLECETQALEPALLRATLDYQRHGEEDHLVLPGARVRVWPDRPEAQIAVHPDLLDHGIARLAAEGALTRALAHHGAMRIHAAAFDLDGSGVVAVGPMGTGKSTLAALVLGAGGRIVSDDALILGRGPTGDILVRPSRPDLLFRDPTPNLLERPVRRALDRVVIGGVEKWKLARITDPDLFLPALLPQAVCLLHRDDSSSLVELEPATKAELLATLMAVNLAPYLTRRDYAADLDRLVGLAMELTDESRILKLRMGNLTPSNRLQFERALSKQLRLPEIAEQP